MVASPHGVGEQFVDVALQVGVDGEDKAAAALGFGALDGGDEVALSIDLGYGAARIAAQGGLVTSLDAHLPYHLVEGIAVILQHAPLLGGLRPDVAEDVAELGAAGVEPPRLDREGDAGKIGRDLLEHEGDGPIESAGDGEGQVALAPVFGHGDRLFNLEDGYAEKVFQVQVEAVAIVRVLGQEAGCDEGGEGAAVLHEGLALAVEDEATGGAYALDDDAIQLGPLGVLGAIDKLHLGEPDAQDHEEDNHGNAQHSHVSVGPVAAEARGDTPIAGKFHRSEPRLLKVERARRPADPAAQAVRQGEHAGIEGGAREQDVGNDGAEGRAGAGGDRDASQDPAGPDAGGDHHDEEEEIGRLGDGPLALDPGGAGEERQVGDDEPLVLDVRGKAEEEDEDGERDHHGVRARKDGQQQQHDDGQLDERARDRKEGRNSNLREDSHQHEQDEQQRPHYSSASKRAGVKLMTTRTVRVVEMRTAVWRRTVGKASCGSPRMATTSPMGMSGG